MQADAFEARRLRIAASVADAIALDGLDGTSLKNIARRMGFTTGVIQHYFDSKDELLRFTKNQYMSNLMQNAFAAYRRAEGPDRLLALCEMLLPLTSERRRVWELAIAFNGEVIGNPQMMREQADQYRKSIELVRGAIAELRGGDTAECLISALGLVSLVEGLSYNLIFSVDGYPGVRPIEILSDYIDGIVFTRERRTRGREKRKAR